MHGQSERLSVALPATSALWSLNWGFTAFLKIWRNVSRGVHDALRVLMRPYKAYKVLYVYMFFGDFFRCVFIINLLEMFLLLYVHKL